MLNVLDDTPTYDKLKQDPTRSYKKVIEVLQKLEQ